MHGEKSGAGIVPGEPVHESSLHETEERYRALVELNPDGVIVHSDDRIIYANPAAVQLAGVTNPTALLGHSIFDFIDVSNHEVIANRIKRMLTSGESAGRIEISARRPDGLPLDLESMATAVPWHGRLAIQVILRDITERKRYEKALRESETRFHQLADSMPQIVWSADAKGDIDYRNKRFHEQTGLKDEDLLRVNIWYKILHPDDAEEASRKWQHSVQTGETFEAEYRYVDAKRGGFRWHLGRAVPVRDEQGKVTRWFGTCTDIHDKKEAEFELQMARDQLGQTAQILEKQVAARTEKLQASVRSMEEFCYSIAHNLRAPLRAMQGFASAMLEDYAPSLDSTGQDYAQRIDRAAGNMDRLVHDLLAYGRLNHQTVQKNPVALEPIVRKVVSFFIPEIKKRNATCEVGPVDFEVRGNESVLEQMFINLISNALKFTKKEVPPELKIWAEKRNGFVRLWIRDNGIGIERELQSRIFRPFERLHTVEAYPGTGIGLAMVAKGAERLGGRAGVDSEPGHGSCFWVEIPAVEKSQK
jgi:PAS domain S-box-containing protein